MNNKFWVLSNIYVCIGYFMGINFLENYQTTTTLLVKTTSCLSELVKSVSYAFGKDGGINVKVQEAI